ncbi:MAG: hypothetical protein QXH90_07570 [Candidatus Korarchaeum sp.]
MLPIVLEMTSESSWREAVMRFAEELKKVFGDRLLRVIALPSPDDDVYDSNVLVIMSKPNQSDRMEVVRIAVEVGDKLNPLVTDEDERTVRLFLAAGLHMRAEWDDEHVRFAEELKKVFGDRLLRVIALPSPDDDVYDSNVLVIMSKPNQSDRMEVVRIAVEVGDKLNPLVTDEDERTIRLFLAAGGRDVEVR